MPNHIPNFQISHFLSSHTIPLLTPPDPTCPICQLPYASPPQTYVHPLLPPDIPEYAVQINNRGPCTHVFGRRCVETHIRGRNPWSHTCPMCRAEWFPPPDTGRREVLEHVERALNGLARLEEDLSAGDEVTMAEVEDLERSLERIREVLYGGRWI
ncbi:hypothetical protein P153DRAFT_383196 [Dothidotthia symphoricarpi CBS 119687]|uniref:RING-type domain-containing protein n=1 Tax=Dothidotthia symphoricarpi CBS 119687 TaxID=1392245 RepID=A0A6A6AL61_9PLEO|nr:uncharacterized protein P153DRAFT_383196 [Dothidotthia symphoricarpi CBS 119687]KAF2132306.1 hypothetical protein P153DRAFT_383196 [Dothidotthia symphoricarpi CBS 119687]